MKAIKRANNHSPNTIVRLAGTLVVAGVVACAGSGFAQMLSIQSGSTIGAPDSIVSIVAEQQGLTQVDPADLPIVGGTFWWVMPGGDAVPAPCAPLDLSGAIFQISEQQFLVDQTGGQVVANTHRFGLQAQATSSTVASEVASEADALVNLISRVQTATANQQMQTMAMDYSGPPSPGDGSGDGGTNTYTPDYSSYTVDYGTNLYLTQIGIAAGNLVGILSNTIPDVSYEIKSRTNLVQNDWFSEGFIPGSELTNWTAFSVPMNNRQSLFIRALSWQDSTGTGIPDWWWLTYFGQITNVDENASAAGDGLSNWQKFELGLNPTNYYNPNPPTNFFGCLDATGTNIILEWSSSPGPVTGYIIQHGIYNFSTYNYDYSFAGQANSNATYFKVVGAYTNTSAQDDAYQLQAVYPGGTLSGTSTWYVGWYFWDVYGPPYSPPAPGNFWANADATGTNVMLSWTPAQGTATNCIILHGIYNPTNYDYNYTQITNLNTGTTNFEIFGALMQDSNWTEAYEIQAVYPGGGLSAPVTTLPNYYSSSSSINVGANTNGPAAPGNFYGYPDSTGTNIFLTWTAVSGAVTNYIVYGGIFDYTTDLIIYHRLAKLGAATNSVEVVGAVDGSGNNLYYIYNVVAVYTNGSLSQSAAWNPGNGAPAPATLNAYLDMTGTNVMLVWGSVPTATGYLVQKSDYYGQSWSYYQIGQVGNNTTSLEDIDGIDSGYNGAESIVYEVQAMYPGGALSSAVTATIATNPPSPGNLSAIVDSTGTNVLLSWSRAAGAVLDYIIERGTYNPNTGTYSYSQIGTVSANTTSFEVVGGFSGGNDNNDIYRIIADYGNGQLSSPVFSTLYQPSPPPTYNINVTAQLVRNQTGRWQLMFSGIPSSVQKIAFYWYMWDYFYDYGPYPDTMDYNNGVPLTTENDIPVSSITNGIYVLPDLWMTNWFPSSALGKVAMVQPIGTNNQYGNLVQVGFEHYDSPEFVDGRLHLKQNILYQLRAATISQPNAPLAENSVYWDPDWLSIGIPVDTNYVESSLFHWSAMFKGYNSMYVEYTKMDNVWPVTVNYELHQNLYDPTFNGPSFNWQPQGGYYTYILSFQGTLVLPSAVLGVGDPYWTSQPITISGGGTTIDPGTGLPVYSPGTISISPDLAAYTNNGSLYLQSGAHNLFGLAFNTALVNNGSPIITLATGSSVAISNVNCFYSQTVDPSLQLVNYYFAPVITPGTAIIGETTPVQPYPLPAFTGFASTNQTGVMIVAKGNPSVIGGWAKYAIQNGASGKYAYLGQYYVTNAPLLNANGTATTNSAGILSPYGDFFPTQAGVAALTTMPDIDPPYQQGTGVVRVVSLDADANHDGTLDFSYFGPDQTSSSRPFRFWADDSTDNGDDGGTGIPGQGARGNAMTQNSLHQYVIHGRRDLVNLFPVYVNIGSLFQSNVLSAGISATDTNWQFVLSQADGVLRFANTSLTPTNYMNYLWDTNMSGNLAWWPGNPSYAVLTTISNSGVALSPSFIAGIATNNQGIILVEAAAPTTQPLVLTIYHGSNQIAQTSLYLSISGVEQMFRHKNLMLKTNAPVLPDRLTDSSVPNEPDTVNKNFVFLHGYNVLPSEARGVAADMYKRMYWSGSQAKFWAVTWEGADTKGTFPFYDLFTPDYHTNVVNAFLTAPNLANFIASLPNGPTVVAAHSLGNMVTLSAISDWNAPISQYFMMDAAVAMEAIDPNAPMNTNMVYSSSYSPWRNYGTYVWASYWYQLFPTNDARSTLTWNNRVGNLRNVDVYNFYSSGEEVLREYDPNPPDSVLSAIVTELLDAWPGGVPFGGYAWAWQEKGKGACSQNWFLGSNHEGWQLNDTLGSGYVYFVNGLRTNIPPSWAAAAPPSQLLVTNAFFNMSVDTAMFTTSTSGSTYAAANRNRILSDAIPALTLPVGANPVPKFAPIGHNADMMAFENGWPAGRGKPSWPPGTTAFGEWHHSDFHQVAYTFTYPLFDQIITIGNLK